MKSECYAYDAAGRLVREGDRTYRYGYLDKVLSVTDGKRSYRYAYHVDGQLARADYGDGRAEDFAWDGLALVRRGDESFVNEPHVGDAPKKLRFGGKPRAKRSARRARKGPRGNPVVSSKGAAYFNDILGTTVGVREGRGASRKGAKRRYTAAALTAFGEPVPVAATSHNSNIRQFDHSIISSPFFTGKPQVEGLGRVFLYRNYRADLAKWQTADPLGYPDGWNQLAYCGNEICSSVDLLGAVKVFCRDENDYGAIKASSFNLKLVEGGSSQFSFSYSDFVDSDGEITIYLNVSLCVMAGLWRNADFGYGDTTAYKKHTGSNNDSVFNDPVYEAVCAHERGHAASFFQTLSRISDDYSKIKI